MESQAWVCNASWKHRAGPKQGQPKAGEEPDPKMGSVGGDFGQLCSAPWAVERLWKLPESLKLAVQSGTRPAQGGLTDTQHT